MADAARGSESAEELSAQDRLCDFTYIDDVVEGVVRVLDHRAAPNPVWSGDSPDPATSPAHYRVYNIGNRRAGRGEHGDRSDRARAWAKG
jgi:UDP-glucuronate 4-epimerase